MNAVDAIYEALDGVSPHVPRLPVVTESAAAHAWIARKAKALQTGAPEAPMPDCIIARESPQRGRYYEVWLGEMSTTFKELTAAQMFATGVLAAREIK